MKAKITKIDVTGVEVESKTFDIPLLEAPKAGDSELRSTMAYRYLLDIGERRYWIRNDGYVIRMDK